MSLVVDELEVMVRVAVEDEEPDDAADILSQLGSRLTRTGGAQPHTAGSVDPGHVWMVRIGQQNEFGEADGAVDVGAYGSERDARVGLANWIAENEQAIGWVDADDLEDYLAGVSTEELIDAYERFWNEDVVDISQVAFDTNVMAIYGPSAANG